MYYIKQNRNSEHVCLRSTLGPWLDCDVTLQFTSRAGGGSCVPWRSERRAYCLVGIGVDSKLLPAKVTWLLTFPKQFDPDLTDDKETSWCSLGSSLDWRRGNLWPLGRQLGLEKLKKKKNIYIYAILHVWKQSWGAGKTEKDRSFHLLVDSPRLGARNPELNTPSLPHIPHGWQKSKYLSCLPECVSAGSRN